MSKTSCFRQKTRTWWEQPINPVFLTLQDRQLNDKFVHKQRTKAIGRLKNVMIIMYVYIACFVLKEQVELNDKMVQFLTQFLPTTMIVTLIFCLTKWKVRIVDFTVLCILIGRIIVTFLLFKWNGDQTKGYENVDSKLLNDSISIVVIPAMLLFSLDFRLEIGLTAPLFAIS